jgi:predicted PurR-regulated permease PerM
MSFWLVGRLLAPLFLVLLAYFVTRPASRWVERRLPRGPLKRLLLIHSDRDKRAYAVGAWLCVIASYAILFGLCALIVG